MKRNNTAHKKVDGRSKSRLTRDKVKEQKRKNDWTGLSRRQLKALFHQPDFVFAEKCKRDFSYFIKTFWECIAVDNLIWNWHIDYLTQQLSDMAKRVAKGLPRENDLIINIPPGTTKSLTCSVMFPVWCWINWYWMRFICASYSASLALEQAELSRELVRSEKFKRIFPDLSIKRDKDMKSNFRVVKHIDEKTPALGGSRFSTSVGGTLTGFHGHMLIVDDPLDPNKSVSDVEIKNANRWIDQTLSTRKVDKAITPTVIIMQRLHQNDPTGHVLQKKQNIKHICIPGEIKNYEEKVNPPELIENYEDGLMDSKRMSWEVLKDLEADLGQYGYAGQIGQNPTPPSGGMFQVSFFSIVESFPLPVNILSIVRYWDKAGSEGEGAYTCGVKIVKLKTRDNKFKAVITDVKRGRWSSEVREQVIRSTAEADGKEVMIYIEQEPGSGGKESAEGTIRNLAGFSAHRDIPTGDKIYRADPYSVQVNNGNISLLLADWNYDFKEEHRYFPYSVYKDQVDAAAGAFNKLVAKKVARRII